MLVVITTTMKTQRLSTPVLRHHKEVVEVPSREAGAS